MLKPIITCEVTEMVPLASMLLDKNSVSTVNVVARHWFGRGAEDPNGENERKTRQE